MIGWSAGKRVLGVAEADAAALEALLVDSTRCDCHIGLPLATVHQGNRVFAVLPRRAGRESGARK